MMLLRQYFLGTKTNMTKLRFGNIFVFFVLVTFCVSAALLTSFVYGGDGEDSEQKSEKSQSELLRANTSLLKEIEEEKKDFEAKKSLIEEESARVRDLKAELERKLAAIKEKEAKIDNMLEAQKIKDLESLKALVRLYEKMKPKDAARVFGELKSLLVADIIELMSERKAGKIMNVMEAKQAADVTKIMRYRNKPYKQGR